MEPSIAELIDRVARAHGFVREDGSYIWVDPVRATEGATPVGDQRDAVVRDPAYDPGVG